MSPLHLMLGLLWWLALIPLQLLGTLAAWLLIPLAVRLARPCEGDDLQDISDRTLDRLDRNPVPNPYRLPQWARWLIELSDDQLLPPGRYEVDIAQTGHPAQSIAMLRRNAGAGLSHLMAVQVSAWPTGCDVGHKPTDEQHGVWLGQVGIYWHLMALVPLTATRNLQINAGWVLRDCFDGHWVPDYRGKFRAPAIRLRRIKPVNKDANA